jgi:alanyl-tRNA synthetase
MENQLKHHGILGMKWGVRRTPEQLGRKAAKKAAAEERRQQRKADAKENRRRKKLARKKLSDLTNDELNERISRLELEKRAKELASSLNPPKQASKGKEFVQRVVEKIGENTLTNVGTQAGVKGLGLAINKAFNVDPYDTTFRIVNPNKGQSDKK